MLRRTASVALSLVLAGGFVVATAQAGTATANTPCTTVKTFRPGTQYAAVKPATSSGSTDCYLVKGNQGRGVKALQRALEYCNYHSVGGFDGIFGNKTRAALIGFQGWAGIKQDGQYGNQTRDKAEFWSNEADGWGFCNR